MCKLCSFAPMNQFLRFCSFGAFPHYRREYVVWELWKINIFMYFNLELEFLHVDFIGLFNLECLYLLKMFKKQKENFKKILQQKL